MLLNDNDFNRTVLGLLSSSSHGPLKIAHTQSTRSLEQLWGRSQSTLTRRGRQVRNVNGTLVFHLHITMKEFPHQCKQGRGQVLSRWPRIAKILSTQFVNDVVYKLRNFHLQSKIVSLISGPWRPLKKKHREKKTHRLARSKMRKSLPCGFSTQII